LQSNRRERRGAIAVFTHHAQIGFRFAKFAQGAAPGLLVVDDDDVHHTTLTKVAAACGASRAVIRESPAS